MSPTMILTPPRRAFETAIPPDLVHVPQARNAAFAIMRLWDLDPSLADDMRLVVSELVSNAIEHGLGRVGLRITETADEVRIEVSDSNPAPARVSWAQDEDPRGRGLMIVASLADSWGVSEDGYRTWAAFLTGQR
ncbi:ATP-binding protein [Streptomyces dioscori]|uniref:ATP-binding protein n=1 Tax=Streptomyces dioscori TaxID=2109333 RepID=A0A2P8PYB3_9ACTN|nr:ATP-binding protein [Streptomyces dioscori]PSM38983.1 ATP-binding protein [Streptomyces dioscori]